MRLPLGLFFNIPLQVLVIDQAYHMPKIQNQDFDCSATGQLLNVSVGVPTPLCRLMHRQVSLSVDSHISYSIQHMILHTYHVSQRHLTRKTICDTILALQKQTAYQQTPGRPSPGIRRFPYAF